LDGWHHSIYSSSDLDIANGTFSGKTSEHCVKCLLQCNGEGAPEYLSYTVTGAPHDSEVTRFDKTFQMIRKRAEFENRTNEFGVGDNGFSSIVKDNLCQNFIFTPRCTDEHSCSIANEIGSVRHSVENLNSFLMNFGAMKYNLRMTTIDFDILCKKHFYMMSLILYIIRETHFHHPLNLT
jgi:hypothetical protein